MSRVSPHAAVDALLAAIESRDLRRIADQLTDDATWQNVPHPAAVGRDAVLALLGPILTRSDRVVWDVVTAATVGTRPISPRPPIGPVNTPTYSICVLGAECVSEANPVENTLTVAAMTIVTTIISITPMTGDTASFFSRFTTVQPHPCRRGPSRSRCERSSRV